MARWEAVLKTFSKTRGTASRNVGRNPASWVARSVTSEEWPSRVRVRMLPTWITRAKTWASGRNSRVAASSSSNSSLSSTVATPSSNMKLPWVSMQPLGRPVVPDV